MVAVSNGSVERKIKSGDQWSGFRGLWLTPISILFLPLCISKSSLLSFTLTDSGVDRSKSCRPRRLEQNSQGLLENSFLALKKKPLETSLSLCLDVNMESCRTDYHQLLSYSQWGVLVLKLSWYWSYKEVDTVGSGTKISEEPEASIALLSHRTGVIQGWPEPHFLNFSQIIWLIDYHCIFCKATGIIKDIRAGVQKDKGWEWEWGLETKWGETNGWMNKETTSDL